MTWPGVATIARKRSKAALPVRFQTAKANSFATGGSFRHKNKAVKIKRSTLPHTQGSLSMALSDSSAV
jgi:hypothetical protein